MPLVGAGTAGLFHLYNQALVFILVRELAWAPAMCSAVVASHLKVVEDSFPLGVGEMVSLPAHSPSRYPTMSGERSAF